MGGLRALQSAQSFSMIYLPKGWTSQGSASSPQHQGSTWLPRGCCAQQRAEAPCVGADKRPRMQSLRGLPFAFLFGIQDIWKHSSAAKSHWPAPSPAEPFLSPRPRTIQQAISTSISCQSSLVCWDFNLFNFLFVFQWDRGGLLS